MTSSRLSITQVRAVDPDTDRDSNIRYSLSGQFAADGTFRVNQATGEIFLTRSLDRDYPRGRPVWNFNVLAHDEVDSGQPSLTGYAEVRVMPRDINDNAPVFDRNRLVGKVAEHSNAGECLCCFSALLEASFFMLTVSRSDLFVCKNRIFCTMPWIKAKLSEISSVTHQLHYTPKHHFII